MQKNKIFHISYIGRLEKEKGIEIVIAAIIEAHRQGYNIVWNICGDGAYMPSMQNLGIPGVILHGRIDRACMDEILIGTDLVFMPSLMLETFGLVALETLSRGVPVCGFAQTGLIPFIHPDLALDPGSPVSSFLSILDRGELPLSDISDFDSDRWIARLKGYTDTKERILIVTDYHDRIGGVEEYVENVSLALRSLGKTVEVFAYRGKTSRWRRMMLMMTTPFAIWRGRDLAKQIQDFSPDLIWMHSIARYIGPHGLRAIVRSDHKMIITHHDLGLIAPRPSRLYSEHDIPQSPHLAEWIAVKTNIFSVPILALKWLYVRWIWTMLSHPRILHLVPTAWMVPHFQKYTSDSPLVFPHKSL